MYGLKNLISLSSYFDTFLFSSLSSEYTDRIRVDYEALRYTLLYIYSMFDIWILKAFHCKIYESLETGDVLFYYNTYFIFVRPLDHTVLT